MAASIAGVATTPAPHAAAAAARRRWADRLPRQPMHVVMFLVAAVSLGRIAGPQSDIDLWWHVRLGDEILRRHTVHGAGADWSFVPAHTSWTSSEWLGEVVLAAVHDAAGWAGISWLRVLLSAWLFLRLYRLIVPGRSLLPATIVYSVTVGWVGLTVQERPQLASLVLLTWLAGHGRDMLRGSAGPRVRVVVALTVLWANVHGLWVLVPALFALVAAGRLADGGRAALPAARRPAVLAAVAVLAGCATPIGPRGLLLPFVLRSSTHAISEWAPTVVAGPSALGLVSLTVPVLVAWARAGTRLPRSEVLYVLALVGFATLAYRSLPPALVLLSPVYADRMSATWPRALTPPRRVERVLLGAVGGAAALACVVAPTVRLVGGDPLPRSRLTLEIAARLAAEPGEHRVLDGYNISGVLLQFAGPRTKVAVDGRADRYGGPYIDRYLDALELHGDWEGLLRELRPTHVVLYADTPLVQVLKTRGWRVVVADDHHYALLEPGR